MRIYSDPRPQRVDLLARDLATILALVIFALIALKVHDAVDKLAVLGTGVRETGEHVPLVGDPIEDLGRAGEDRVHRLANLLGIVFFVLPAGILLFKWLPERARQARALSAAGSVFVEPENEERRRLIAMRAAFSLPYGKLLEYTQDPLGDLAAERYDALIRAALDDVGLRPR